MNRRLHILLADDDEVFRLLTERALSATPADGCVDEVPVITCVSDGSDALAYLRGEAPYEDREAHPLPDLVLLDQRMNRVDGSEALAEIKRDPALAALPVCILSTSDEERLRALCYATGASFFIRKALDYEELKRKLQLMLAFFRDVVELRG